MNKILNSTETIRDELRIGFSVVIESLKHLGMQIKARLKDTLSDRRALTSMCLLVAIVALSATGGYLVGQVATTGQQGLVEIPANFSGSNTLSAVPAVQSGKIERPDASLNSAPAETSKQLGQLRAELLRLHTLFVLLAERAELDDGEFDLQSPLLDWKEQSSLEQIGLLKRRIAHMSANGATMRTIFDIRRMAYDQRISGRPLVNGQRSSGFGYRKDPITGERHEHHGLDFSGPVGEPILALADGIVTYSGINSGYGNLVEIEHVDGLRTRYAHNQAILVKSGKRVKKGEMIATLGSTGRSTGPHVHIEVRQDGSPIDPGFFIR